MGGVLQASLTIFGVVGGPLFGLFTLGMFTTRANEKGSVIGLISGIVFSMWVGFGGPKPPPPYLPVSVEGCVSNILLNSTITFPISTASKLIDETEYFWLFKLSYMWYCVLGFTVTILVGYFLSFIFEQIGIQGRSKIYLDDDETCINTDLFSPPIARRLKRKFATHLERGGNVS